MKRLNVYFLGSLFFWMFLWVWSKETDAINDLFLPSPSQMLHSFSTLFFENGFTNDIFASVFRVFSAFLLSAISAIPLAILMCSYKPIRQTLSPYIDFIRYLPVPVLIPLTILFFGIDETAKIALLFIGTFFQLVLLVIDDINEMPSEYYDLTYALQFSKVQEMKFTFMSVLPQIYDNSRITLGWCWTYVVIAELVASDSGIGHMIKEAQRFSNTPNVYVGIITMGFIGFVTDNAFKQCYPILFKYKQKTRIVK
ncbi:MAG: ABC transporter permease [Gallionellaceae bacterium]